jgi:hypothetical protein
MFILICASADDATVIAAANSATANAKLEMIRFIVAIERLDTAPGTSEFRRTVRTSINLTDLRVSEL